MRKKTAPGSYRILPRGNTYLLSGVTTTGNRIKVPGLSLLDAKAMATQLFASPTIGPITPPLPQSVAPPSTAPVLDDYGLPAIRTTPVQSQTLNASLGISGPPSAVPPVAKPPVDDGEADKRVKRAKQAKSLMELAGVAWAAGDVWMGRRLLEWRECEPLLPNPRQVNDLADVTKETFAQWFGDRTVEPWQMMILLSIGIPMSMLLQARKRKDVKPDLKAV